MNFSTLTRPLASWRLSRAQSLRMALAGVYLLTSLNAFSQASVATLTDANHGTPGYVNGNTYSQAQFNYPAGIALDPSATSLFVADYNNNAIRWVNNLGNQSSSFTYSAFISTDGINHPIAIGIDIQTNIYVLNQGSGNNGTVLKFNGNLYVGFGLKQSPATNAFGLTNATSLVLDSSDNIYVTVKSNTVIRIAAGNNAVTTVGVITNKFTSLRGVAIMNNGKLALTDAGNNGIWVMDPANTTNLVNNSVKFAGFNGPADTNGPAGFAAFYDPENIAAAGNGILVVTDFKNNKVKYLDASGTVYRLYGVSSKYWSGSYQGWREGAANQNETIAQEQSRQPYGLAIAPDGSIYDTETYYCLLRKATSTGLLPPPPPIPLTPTITVVAGYGQVSLTWSPVTSATNYNVKRSTSSGGETTIFSTSGTSYTDLNVLDGTNYFYAVSALNTSGESPNSTEASAQPLFSPTPTNLLVTAAVVGQISLAWAPSAGATSYNVLRSTSTNTFTIIGSTSGLTYNDTALTPGQVYYYEVAAVNTGGQNPTNSSIVSVTALVPPPPQPSIGWFDYEGNPAVTTFHPVSGAAFTSYNDLMLAIVPNADGVTTIYTDDGSTPSLTNGASPNSYANGSQTAVTPLQVNAQSHLKIQSVSISSGGSSAISTAIFNFVVGNPSIGGNNAAQFTINDVTAGAQFLYTTDGTIPTRTNQNATLVGPISLTNGLTLSLQFPHGVDTILFQIVGIKPNYFDSAVIQQTFSATNYSANTINFGFASGPGSSQFIASPGQYFVVPIGVSLLPNPPPIYGLQFYVTLTNLGSSYVDPNTITFETLLGKPDPNEIGYVDPIDPLMFVSASQPPNDPYAIPYGDGWYQSLEFTDTNSDNLLGIGWLEVYGRTNLYNTLNQTLLTYPSNEGTDIGNTPNQEVIGQYGFNIPTNASPGDAYQIQIGRPSGTTFPGGATRSYGTPVYFDALAKTNLLGAGSISGLKNVTIGQIKYLVGDVYPANWYNAGDFGSKNLVNVDVIRVFDFAVYPIASPPPGSDLFDALDSSGNTGLASPAGYYVQNPIYPFSTVFFNAVTNYTYTYNTNGAIITQSPGFIDNFTNLIYSSTVFVNIPYTITNIYQTIPPTTVIEQTNYAVFISNPGATYALFNGNDTTINQIAFGDGQLDVSDVYVTYRRSLDTNSLVWFERFWTNGVRVAVAYPAPVIEFGSQAAGQAVIANPVLPKIQSQSQPAVPPQVHFFAGDITNGSPGQVVQIPINATIYGSYPLRVLMLNLTVEPLDGSPPLTTAVSFTPSAAIGAPTSGFTDSRGPGNYCRRLAEQQDCRPHGYDRPWLLDGHPTRRSDGQLRL
jgi:hypothetical protein